MQNNSIKQAITSKFFILLMIVVVLFSSAVAQSPYKSATDGLRAVFSGMTNPNASVRFFYDIVAHSVDSIYYNPIVAYDTNNVDVFYQLFMDDRYMAYDTTILITTDSLFNLAWPHIQNDTFPVGITDFKCNLLKADALDTNIWFDFDTVLNVISDKAGRPSSPYESTQNIFAASTLFEG